MAKNRSRNNGTNKKNYKTKEFLADIARVYTLDGPAFLLIKSTSRFGNRGALAEITRQANLLGWSQIVVAVVEDLDEIAHYQPQDMAMVGWFHRDEIERLLQKKNGVELLKQKIEFQENDA